MMGAEWEKPFAAGTEEREAMRSSNKVNSRAVRARRKGRCTHNAKSFTSDWQIGSFITPHSRRLPFRPPFFPENRFDCFFNGSHRARSDKNIHKPIPIPQQSHCRPLFSAVCSRRAYTRPEFLEILSLKNYFVNFTLGMERLGGDEHK